VPAYQRFVGGRLLLPAFCWWLDWDRATDLMDRQANRLAGLAAGQGEERLTRRVLTRPQIGLEDSSRRHSYAMVLEHLTIVGERVASIVVDLANGIGPTEALRTADLKPLGRMTADRSMAEYRAMLERFRHRVTHDARDRASSLRFEHPWFGPLDAYRWLCFAPFHQAIHLKQARRILRGLGDQGSAPPEA